jgi:hypothetical protein
MPRQALRLSGHCPYRELCSGHEGDSMQAEEGQLTILASGPDSARRQVEPVFAALAETMHLCQLMGLEEQHFVTLPDGGPLGPSYGVETLGEMQRHEYPAGFPCGSRSKTSSSSGRSRTAQARTAAARRRPRADRRRREQTRERRSRRRVRAEASKPHRTLDRPFARGAR